jgi:hypothetical protein
VEEGCGRRRIDFLISEACREREVRGAKGVRPPSRRHERTRNSEAALFRIGAAEPLEDARLQQGICLFAEPIARTAAGCCGYNRAVARVGTRGSRVRFAMGMLLSNSCAGCGFCTTPDERGRSSLPGMLGFAADQGKQARAPRDLWTAEVVRCLKF